MINVKTRSYYSKDKGKGNKQGPNHAQEIRVEDPNASNHIPPPPPLVR